jgi:hypothetical protein
MIPPGIRAGLDGREAVVPVDVRLAPTRAEKMRIERRRVCVTMVTVPAGRVGLPYFDKRVAHRPTVFVDHST